MLFRVLWCLALMALLGGGGTALLAADGDVLRALRAGETGTGTSLVNGLGGPAGFGEGILARNDDGSTALIDLQAVFPQGIQFFGRTFTGVYLNNNGNLTFDRSLSQFTPTGITAGTQPMIAAWFADVDTRGGSVTAPTPGGTSSGTNLVYYSLDPARGIATFTWDDVGYFGSHNDLLNAFQIRLIRGAAGGDFGFEFRYEALNWTTGDASGGSHGLGGVPARAGYSAGDGVHFYELPQSGNQAAMLHLTQDSNAVPARPGYFSWSVSTPRPTMVFDPVGSYGYTNASPLKVIVTFSEAVTGLDASDFSFLNARLLTMTGSGTRFELTLAPYVAGEVRVTMRANAVVNEFQNGNPETTASITYDNVPPELRLDSDALDPVEGPFEVTLTASEFTLGFDASDLLVGGPATLDGLHALDGGSQWAFRVIPLSPGAISVAVSAASVSDLAGNANASQVVLTRTYTDRRPPVVTVSAGSGPFPGPFAISFELSKPAASIDESQLVVANGVCGSVTGAGTTWSGTVTPSADGLVEITAGEGFATDIQGNRSATSVSLHRTVDMTQPAIVLTGPAQVHGAFEVLISPDESVWPWFEYPDVPSAWQVYEALVLYGIPVVANGYVANGAYPSGFTGDLRVRWGDFLPVQQEGLGWRIKIQPLATGALTVAIPVGLFSDQAGNAAASNELVVDVVRTNQGAPQVVAEPTISGDRGPGTTWTLATGQWTDVDGDAIQFLQRWRRNRAPTNYEAAWIPDATGPTYVTGPQDTWLSAVVTATDGLASTSFTTPWFRASNVAPVVESRSVDGREDEALTVPLLGLDAEGDPVTLSLLDLPSASAGALDRLVVGNGRGSVRFTPAANWSGTATFTYLATDHLGAASAPGTVTLVFAPVDDGAPVNLAAPRVVDAGDGIWHAEPGIWFDPDGDLVDLGYVWQVSAVNSGGTILDAGGPDLLPGDGVYFARVGVTGSALGRVGQTATSAWVQVRNRPPLAPTVLVTANEDQMASFLVPAVDPDGGVVKVDVIPGPGADQIALGEASAAGTRCTFRPLADWNGSLTVGFVATDAVGATATGAVFISVVAVNDPPRFRPGPAVTVLEGGQLTIPAWLGGVAGGPGEEAGDPVTFRVESLPGTVSASIDAAGTLVVVAQSGSAGSYQAVVQGRDPGGAVTAAVLAITVVPAAERLVISAPDQLLVPAWDDQDGPGGLPDAPGSITCAIQVLALNGAVTPTAGADLLGAQVQMDSSLHGQILTYVPPRGVVGEDHVTITAVDGSFRRDRRILVRIVAMATPPAVGSATTQSSSPQIDPGGRALRPLVLPTAFEGLTPASLGLDGAVLTWRGGAWIRIAADDELDPTQAYWLAPSTRSASAPQLAAAPQTVVERGLELGWNALAMPIGDGQAVPWSVNTIEVLVTQGSVTALTLGQAYEAGWIELTAWRLGAEGYVPVRPADAFSPVIPAGVAAPEHELRAGSGYFIKVLRLPVGGALTLRIAVGGSHG